ncbi:MAG TPA: hypothetical protein VFA77_16050, partial [Candidatus Eisenbacteria bacterium]|nr:hypothetical protein [Candidatus Eisenbacteria bacterium]
HLYAGGDFTTAGGVNVNQIARWDGKAWSALGSGLSGSFGTEAATLRQQLALSFSPRQRRLR